MAAGTEWSRGIALRVRASALWGGALGVAFAILLLLPPTVVVILSGDAYQAGTAIFWMIVLVIPGVLVGSVFGLVTAALASVFAAITRNVTNHGLVDVLIAIAAATASASALWYLTFREWQLWIDPVWVWLALTIVASWLTWVTGPRVFVVTR